VRNDDNEYMGTETSVEAACDRSKHTDVAVEQPGPDRCDDMVRVVAQVASIAELEQVVEGERKKGPARLHKGGQVHTEQPAPWAALVGKELGLEEDRHGFAVGRQPCDMEKRWLGPEHVLCEHLLLA
jgi:hypothetical protein